MSVNVGVGGPLRVRVVTPEAYGQAAWSRWAVLFGRLPIGVDAVLRGVGWRAVLQGLQRLQSWRYGGRHLAEPYFMTRNEFD